MDPGILPRKTITQGSAVAERPTARRPQAAAPLKVISVCREALLIRVEVQDLHRLPCRSRGVELGAA